MEKKEKLVLKINNEKEIASKEDLAQFIAAERDHWESKIINDDRRYHSYNTIIFNAVYKASLDALDNILNRWEKDVYPVEEISVFNAFSRDQYIPYLYSSIGAYCNTILDKDLLTGIYMLYLYAAPAGNEDNAISQKHLAYYAEVAPQQQNIKVDPIFKSHTPYLLKASRLLLKFDMLADQDAQKVFLASLNDVHGKIIAIENKSEGEYQKLLEWRAEYVRRQEAWFSEIQTMILKRGKGILKRLVLLGSKRLRTSRKILETSKAAFESQVNFNETVKYWFEKEKDHKKIQKILADRHARIHHHIDGIAGINCLQARFFSRRHRSETDFGSLTPDTVTHHYVSDIFRELRDSILLQTVLIPQPFSTVGA